MRQTAEQRKTCWTSGAQKHRVFILQAEEDDEFSPTFKLTLANALILSPTCSMFTDLFPVDSGLCIDA